MKKITRDELLDLTGYEKVRQQVREQVIATKKLRRLPVGEIVTLVFENRQTVLFQIQEMIRAERIVDEARILEEMEIYNQLIPGDGEISATMFLEIPDAQGLRQWLPKLVHIEHHVALEIGDRVVRGVAEGGRSTAETTSTVHYLKFPLDQEAQRAFREGQTEIAITVDHPNYRARALLPDALRRSLAEELSAAPVV